MRERLRNFLQTALGQPGAVDATDGPADVRVAVAALLVEMARADFTEVPEERHLIHRLLAEHFSLERREAEHLLGLADRQADDAVSLQDRDAGYLGLVDEFVADIDAMVLMLEQYAQTFGVNLDTSPPLPSTIKAVLLSRMARFAMSSPYKT